MHPLEEELYAFIKADKVIFEFMQQGSFDGMWLWDLDPKGDQWISARFWELLGYDPIHMPHKFEAWHKTIDEENQKEVFSTLRKAIKSRKSTFEQEVIFTHKNGEQRWFKCRALVISNETDKPIRLFGVQRDITREKISFKKMEVYDAIVNSIPTILYWRDTNFRYLGSNERFIRGTEFKSVDDLVGKSDEAFPWKDTAARYIRDDKKVIKEATELDYEEEFFDADGKRSVWKTSKAPLKNQEGEILGVVGMVENISAEREARDIIRENELKFRKLFEQSPVAIQVYDKEGVLIDVNYQTLKLFGLVRKEEILGFNLWQHPELSKEKRAALKKNQNIKLSTTFEGKEANKYVEGLKSTSGLTYLDLYVAPLLEGNDVRGYIVHVTDETKRQLAELRLQEQNDKLESLNEELRHTNEELLSAKQKADNANRLKSEFLHNMSHEIRTPMNGIIGFADLLNKPGLTDSQRKSYVQIVRNSSNQLLRTIDDILEISVLETKQIKLNEETFSLNDFLMEIFSIFNLKSNDLHLPLHLKKGLEDDKSYIVSDRFKLHKILSNLLENAFKFTMIGYIEFGYYLQDEFLILYVKDTGTGISSEDYKLIFERFAQGNNESHSMRGLGLGLSISRENAKLLGGDIVVESGLGEGSTFFVSIPYNPVKGIRKPSAISLDESPSDEERPTILIAEDEEVNYFYLETILSDNYSILRARNGQEAVNLCTQHKEIKLILMDLKMPVMSGQEATRIIKAQSPNIRIIAYSAFTTKSDIDKALNDGFDEFVTKPVDREDLYQLIKKCLSKKDF